MNLKMPPQVHRYQVPNPILPSSLDFDNPILLNILALQVLQCSMPLIL